MTARKCNLHLPSRTPAYVSCEVGAAELGISPETWNRWVADGTLPPCAPGFPASTPRWKWADVDRKLSSPAAAEDSADVDPFVVRAGLFKNGASAKRKPGAPRGRVLHTLEKQ
jgi:hypothetical protein